MDKTKWSATTGLCLGTAYLCQAIPTTFAFDKPLLGAIVFLVTLGYALIEVARFLERRTNRTAQDTQYDGFDALPSTVWREIRALRRNSHVEDVAYPSSQRKLRRYFVVLVFAIFFRVQIFLRVLANVECATVSLEPLVPLGLAAWYYWTSQRPGKRAQARNPNDDLHAAQKQHSIEQPHGELLGLGLLSIGGIIALAAARAPASTYICTAALNLPWMFPLLQLAGVIVDIVILICLRRMLSEDDTEPTGSLASRLASVGKVVFYAAAYTAVLFLIMTIVYYLAFTKLAKRARFFTIPTTYIWSALKLDIALCITVLCGFFSLLHAGPTATAAIPTFVSICILTTVNAWNIRLAYPPTQGTLGLLAFSMALSGFAAYLHYSSLSHRLSTPFSRSLFQRVPRWLYLAFVAILAIRATLWATERTAFVNYHPIDLLMYEAREAHDTYVNRASASKTLAEAVKTYRERYSKHPPPGFQHWYSYATARNSVIIDEFDSIAEDLLPFQAFSPQQIRERTWELASNLYSDVSGLSIRNGVLTIAPNVYPTHRWMLEGIIRMIQPFAEFLPDMDLAFNVNDEPRVAVPFQNIEDMRRRGMQSLNSDERTDNSFSAGRANRWKDIPAQASGHNFMEDFFRQRTFYEYGSIACPSGSTSRRQRAWDVQRHCTSCAEPHSIGPFLSNWTLAADVCHQPDLADLHGIYISPASFKGTHELYPIFSQSKVSGYNDILYPSAWNYIRKAKYEPSEQYPDVPFRHKNSTLFWRGGTTEGISHDFGHWRGFARQRIVRLVNDISGPSSPQTILHPLRNEDAPPKYQYISASVSELTKLISTDVRFVGQINRCNGLDCLQQEREFAPLAPPSDFQAQWQYKYLLDMDGAGFSGRFLPFLESHSLPFKAGLFREWWDDRLTAWHHFVPIDIRGHGFWATLAYFAGFDGILNGRSVRLEAHDDHGERIAENGREWAHKALRKEDMEIYLFRLLLEWGRLTDDRRDEIGFDIDIEQ